MRAALAAVPAGAVVQLGNSLPIRVVDHVAGRRRAAHRAHPARRRRHRRADRLGGAARRAAGAPVLLVLGDVSFAHDLGGLLAARLARRAARDPGDRQRRRPDLRRRCRSRDAPRRRRSSAHFVTRARPRSGRASPPRSASRAITARSPAAAAHAVAAALGDARAPPSSTRRSRRPARTTCAATRSQFCDAHRAHEEPRPSSSTLTTWTTPPRLRRHPLRDLGRRHREDHDQPARGPQRVPAADRRRDDPRVRRRPRRRLGRRRDPHRRRRRGVLLRRRPARPRQGRLRRRRWHPAPQRPRSADAHPLPAQAGRRDGRRLRDRRRPRAPPGLRPDDRRRQRAVRPDRAAGRQLRRRVRQLVPRPDRRPEEGARDLVPVPPVRRQGGARHGPRQHGRAARRARGDDDPVVPRDARSTRRPRCASSRWR